MRTLQEATIIIILYYIILIETLSYQPPIVLRTNTTQKRFILVLSQTLPNSLFCLFIDRSAPDKILSELALLETTAPSSVKEESQLKDAVKKSYQHWLLRFPTQCVVITEAIIWAKDVRRGLKDGSKDKLQKIR